MRGLAPFALLPVIAVDLGPQHNLTVPNLQLENAAKLDISVNTGRAAVPACAELFKLVAIVHQPVLPPEPLLIELDDVEVDRAVDPVHVDTPLVPLVVRCFHDLSGEMLASYCPEGRASCAQGDARDVEVTGKMRNEE